MSRSCSAESGLWRSWSRIWAKPRDESRRGGSFSEVSTESCWWLHFPSLTSKAPSNLTKELWLSLLGVLFFFFLQAIKALLPVQEKLGLLLAKMGNTGKQNVCLDLHAAGETSSIKPEAAMLCQAVLSWCSYGLGVKSIVINYAGNSKLLHTLWCSNSASKHRQKLDYVLLTLLLYLLWLLLYWLCTMAEVS